MKDDEAKVIHYEGPIDNLEMRKMEHSGFVLPSKIPMYINMSAVYPISGFKAHEVSSIAEFFTDYDGDLTHEDEEVNKESWSIVLHIVGDYVSAT